MLTQFLPSSIVPQEKKYQNIKLSLLYRYIISSNEYLVKKINYTYLINWSVHSYFPGYQELRPVLRSKKKNI